jgi:hypothetical protein
MPDLPLIPDDNTPDGTDNSADGQTRLSRPADAEATARHTPPADRPSTTRISTPPPAPATGTPTGATTGATTRATTAADATRRLSDAAPNAGKPPMGTPQPVAPPTRVSNLPPMPPNAQAEAQPPMTQTGPQGQQAQPSVRGRARRRRDSGLYLPLWSLALMLVVVLAAAGGIIMLVLGLGAPSAPPATPRIVITPPEPTRLLLPTALPTLPPLEATTAAPVVQATFALEGPTLPAVLFTNTPAPITVGGTVIVNAQESGLNVRNQPGTSGTNILFVAAHQSLYTVIGGPTQADSLTWWQIQSVDNPSLQGWGASSFLEPYTP